MMAKKIERLEFHTGSNDGQTWIRHPNFDDVVDKVNEIIEQLNGAEQEVQHGRWIDDNDAIVHGHCSVCGWVAIWQETDVYGMLYCPNCGSKMNGSEKDE